MDYALKQRVDAFVRGEAGEQEIIAELCGACAQTPDLVWEVMALADQYHRRGKISAEFGRAIRDAIVRPALARQSGGSAFVPVTPLQPVVPTATAAETVELRAPAPPPPVDGVPSVVAERSFGADAEGARRGAKWLRPTELAATLAALVIVIAYLALRDPPIAELAVPAATPVAEPAPSPEAEPAATPKVEPAASPRVAPDVEAAAVSDAPAVAEAQQLSLDREQYIVRPGEHEVLIRVLRTGGSTGQIGFTWWTRPSGARPGADYRARSPTVAELPPDAEAATFSIPIIANPKRTHTEIFYVAIGKPSGGAALGAVRSSVVIIMPNQQ
jgi:hypothetical protein